jgi:hypothetical protein
MQSATGHKHCGLSKDKLKDMMSFKKALFLALNRQQKKYFAMALCTHS